MIITWELTIKGQVYALMVKSEAGVCAYVIDQKASNKRFQLKMIKHGAVLIELSLQSCR
jgi:hypothetical protein